VVHSNQYSPFRTYSLDSIETLQELDYSSMILRNKLYFPKETLDSFLSKSDYRKNFKTSI